MNLNALPLNLSGCVAEAATHTSLTEPPAQSASTALANGRIVFVSRANGSGTNFDIYTINADGSNRQQLTSDPADDFEPVWSRDGTKIVFVRDNSSSRGIYVMNADGSDQRRLTAPAANNFHYSPSWSPDGTKIAFASFFAFDNGNVIVMNADGSDQRTITGGGFLNPSWSPDGLKIAGNFGYDGLVLINIDGSNFTHITQPPQPFDPATYFADFEPAWSPDGSKIVFSRYVDCDVNDCYTSRLYVINSDGSNPTDLTRQNNFGSSPAWSPDGRKIIFGSGDLYVINPDGSGLTNLTNTNDRSEASPSWQPVALPPVVNPIDDPQFFVRQHYLDFLGREPEAEGLAFWTGEITSCGGDLQCVEAKRINVSAAFFLSIEFQQTGFLIHRLYRASFERMPRLQEFLPDTRQIGQGVIVNSPGWEQRLESNKQAFVSEWVSRAAFRALYDSKTDAEYVDALIANTGAVFSQAERDALVSGLSGGAETRATALRKVAETRAFNEKELNPAFVHMQYFGYLRRNPDDAPDNDMAGYNYWLQKLLNHGGDHFAAEMVKSFLVSQEYRRRFANP